MKGKGSRLSREKLPKGKKASPVAFWVIDASYDTGDIRMARQRMRNYALAAGALTAVILLIAFDLQIAFPRG